MNKIILHGELREQYGESFNVSCRDPSEAYRALACQLSGFRERIRHGEFNLVREMPNGSFAVTEDMLYLGMDNCKLHFLPSIEGNANGNKGGAKAILGVAIIGASLFIPGGAAGAAIAGLSLQTMGVMTGAALALGGLALVLAPTPALDTGKGDNKDSFLFNGNVNPSGQNLAVPIGFGLFRVPGVAVASQIVTNEVNTGNPALTDLYERIEGSGGSYYYSDEAAQ